MSVDWQFVAEVLPKLLWAGVVTIEATLTGFALAAVLGLVLALARRSRSPLISWPVKAFIEFVRSTPLLVQIFFLFFGLPQIGVSISALLTGIIALGVHYSTYTSEVYRAGLDSVPKGQWEGAATLCLSRYQMYRYVILPQAIPPMIPALGNYLIAMFKETPLLSAIAVIEIMQMAKLIGSKTFRYFEPITIVGIFFLIVSLVAAAIIRRLETRSNKEWSRPG